jgi:cyclophilin family peptidyl-prolyl cis-trans isomerase
MLTAQLTFAQSEKAREMKKKETMEKTTAKSPIVVMETSMGNVEIELYPDRAPKTVENFLTYVREEYYDGTIFHRVIKNFMIQGGGFTTEKKEKATKNAVINEADNGLKNDIGTIAMARTPDPNSATSQFFINVKDNPFLNFSGKTQEGWGYCVFGKVISGMDIVEKIKSVKTGTSQFETHGQKAPFQDVPVETVVIKSMAEKK